MRLLIKKYLIKRLIKQGAQIGENSQILGIPRFGSEPYLVSIGNEVTITAGVNFITHDGAVRVFKSNPQKYDGKIHKFGRIVVYDNSFVGLGSTIMPGVSIGPNSVVAAGSVVTKNVPPNTIVGGNPAKPIMTIDDYYNKLLTNTPADLNLKSGKKEGILKEYPYPW